MTDQNTNTIKVQYGEPVSYIGVAYNNTGDGFLTGAESLKGNSSIINVPFTIGGGSQPGNPEPTAQPEGSTTGWRVFYLGWLS